MCSGDLGRPGTPIIRDRNLPDRGRLRAGRVDLRRPRARAPGRGHPILAETVRRSPTPAACCWCRRSPSAGRRRWSGSWTGSSNAARSRRCRSTSTRPWRPRRPGSTGAGQYFDEETARLLRDGATPLDYPAQIVVNTPKESGAIQFATRPYLIVASNGMLTGGRVVGHLRNLIDDPNATCCSWATRGRDTRRPPAGRRQDGAPRWAAARGPLQGSVDRRVLGARRRGELLDWIGRFGQGKQPGEQGFPKSVPRARRQAQEALQPKVRVMGFETHIRTGTSG